MSTPKEILRGWMFPAPRVKPRPVTKAYAESLHSSISSHRGGARHSSGVSYWAGSEELVMMRPREFMALMQEINDEWTEENPPHCPPMASIDEI